MQNQKIVPPGSGSEHFLYPRFYIKRGIENKTNFFLPINGIQVQVLVVLIYPFSDPAWAKMLDPYLDPDLSQSASTTL
jgi:hypothetical protein